VNQSGAPTPEADDENSESSGGGTT
jgi:hypothetical protein